MKPQNRRNYRAKLILVFLLSLALAASLSWIFAAKADLGSLSKLINIAGKQRMLSQKVAYTATLASVQSDSLDEYVKAEVEFSANALLILETLRSGGFKEADFYSPSVRLTDPASYVAKFRQVATQQTVQENTAIYAASQKMLGALNEGVSLMESRARGAATMLQAAIVSAAFAMLLWLLCFYRYVIKPRFDYDRSVVQKNADALEIYKRFFDESQDGVLLFDSQWSLLAANRSSYLLVQQPEESLAAAEAYWLDQVFGYRERQIRLALENSGSWRETVSFTADGGSDCHFSISAVRIRPSNHEDEFYGVTVKDLTELQQKQNETEVLARCDSLTGVYNRSAILQKLEQACRIASANDSELALLFLDIDGFKTVNDLYGHVVGDSVLQHIAKLLQYQTSQLITLARLGGDEFVLVVENVENAHQIDALCARLNGIFAQALRVDDKVCDLGVSIGVSLFPTHTVDPAELVKYADIAMYHSKKGERNRSKVFEHSMLDALVEKHNVEVRLAEAVAGNELTQVFQPIVDLKDGKFIGVELLLRWSNGSVGIMSPEEFIPIAEQTGLIYHIDEWSFDQAILAIKQAGWLGYLSINLSSVHFNHFAIIDAFIGKLGEANLPNKVIFELTETAIIEDAKKSAALIQRIKRAGFFVAIDDFGTGYTSLYYLKALPYDYIKIDGSFVQDMATNETSFSIVKAIIGLAKSLQIGVIAEGVDTPEVSKLLSNLGCDFAQGFYYSKPIEMDTLMASERVQGKDVQGSNVRSIK